MTTGGKGISSTLSAIGTGVSTILHEVHVCTANNGALIEPRTNFNMWAFIIASPYSSAAALEPCCLCTAMPCYTSRSRKRSLHHFLRERLMS